MITFINKPTELKKNDKQLGYIDLALITLDTMPEEGWTTSEMRQRIKIEDKLQDIPLEGEIQLEDAEFNKIYEVQIKTKWTSKHRDIVAYEDYLKELKS